MDFKNSFITGNHLVFKYELAIKYTRFFNPYFLPFENFLHLLQKICIFKNIFWWIKTLLLLLAIIIYWQINDSSWLLSVI